MLFDGELCPACYPTSTEPKPESPAPRSESPQPREFAMMTPELRLAHIGNWMAFYVAGLRMESPLNPGVSARRAAVLADAALGRLLKCIPQLARPAAEDINPIETQQRCECELCVTGNPVAQMKDYPTKF
jgi:hypothetical protein